MDYPERPKFWCCSYLRELFASGDAAEIGAQGIAILVRVVTAEDGGFYKAPVSFTDAELAEVCGMSVSSLQRHRGDLVRSGHLCYESGSRANPARYFVERAGRMILGQIDRELTIKQESILGQIDRESDAILGQFDRELPTPLIRDYPNTETLFPAAPVVETIPEQVAEKKPAKKPRSPKRSESELAAFKEVFDSLLELCGLDTSGDNGRAAKLAWKIVDERRWPRPITGAELLDRLPGVCRRLGRAYQLVQTGIGGTIVPISTVEQCWTWLRQEPTGSLADTVDRFRSGTLSKQDLAASAAAAAKEMSGGLHPIYGAAK